MHNIILDTDVGNDIDDVLALAVLYSLHQQKKIDFKAILISKAADDAPRFTDYFNQTLGLDIPIGKTDRGVAIPFNTYLHLTGLFVERSPKLAAKMHDDYPLATEVLRNQLNAADDASIDLVTIGFLSNIGDFLKGEKDAALFNKKVRRIFMMAGNYKQAQPEFNVMMDIPAFKAVLETYQGPIDFIGFELGKVRYPEVSIRRLYEEGRHDVIWLSYFSYATRPHQRQCWDPITTVVASGLYEDCYSFSEPGRVTVEGNGITKHEAENGGPHRFVTIDPVQERRIRETMVELVEGLR